MTQATLWEENKTNQNLESLPILVVDRHEIQELICRSLQSYGYRAVSASPSQAPQLLSSQPFALLITNQPQLLTGSHRPLRLLYISGDLRPELLLALPETVSDWLAKPFGIAELINKVRQLLSVPVKCQAQE